MSTRTVTWLCRIVIAGIASLGLACNGGRLPASLADHSVAAGFHGVPLRNFAPQDRPAFPKLLTLGSLDGTKDTAFGFVTSAALRADGGIYVTDPYAHRVDQFTGRGSFVRSVGRTGEGPGEFLAPFSVVAFDTVFAVYDSQLGRVSVFDTAGTFRSSFLLNIPGPSEVRRGPNSTLLVVSPLVDSMVHEVDLTGAHRLTLPVLGGGVVRRNGRLVAPPPGNVCVDSLGSIVYANPWFYELAFFDGESGRLQHVVRYRSDVLTVRTTGSASRPGAILLGLQCSGSRIVFAYADLRNRHLFYDFLDDSGAPVGRLSFSGPAEDEYPGFVADARLGQVVAFRTRPFPQVFEFQIRP